MAVHIALMNVAAPLAAILLYRAGVVPPPRSRWLWMASVAQIVLLWAAHAPALHDAAMSSEQLGTGLLVALFVSALGFWLSLVSHREKPPWQEILALLVTGKLACLLAALLVFAPRPLYALGHHAADLADQQLAGLLMIAACPLSYILAALVLAVQMIAGPQLSRPALAQAQPLARQTA